MSSSEIHLLLGEIKGKLEMVIDGQAEIKQDISQIKTRVSKTERINAQYGVGAGAIAAVGIELIKKQMGM